MIAAVATAGFALGGAVTMLGTWALPPIFGRSPQAIIRANERRTAAMLSGMGRHRRR